MKPRELLRRWEEASGAFHQGSPSPFFKGINVQLEAHLQRAQRHDVGPPHGKEHA